MLCKMATHISKQVRCAQLSEMIVRKYYSDLHIDSLLPSDEDYVIGLRSWRASIGVGPCYLTDLNQRPISIKIDLIRRPWSPENRSHQEADLV